MQRDFPRLKTFATLSPLPTLRLWADRNPDIFASCFAPDLAKLAKQAGIADAEALRALLPKGEWAEDARLARLIEPGLIRLAARYLVTAKSGEKPLDPVARFHLGNGARIERLNFLADTAPKGFKQSYGMMVNYLYEPDDLEENVEAFMREGRVVAVAAVRHAAKG